MIVLINKMSPTPVDATLAAKPLSNITLAGIAIALTPPRVAAVSSTLSVNNAVKLCGDLHYTDAQNPRTSTVVYLASTY